MNEKERIEKIARLRERMSELPEDDRQSMDAVITFLAWRQARRKGQSMPVPASPLAILRGALELYGFKLVRFLRLA